MQQPAASPETAVSASELAATGTRLSGRWLFIAREGWIVLTLLILTLSAIALLSLITLSQSTCRLGAYCLDA